MPRKALTLLALAVVGGAAMQPVCAQTLLHRYSMNGNANDSVGTAHGTVVGRVTFTTSAGVNGSAHFPGGNSANSPSYLRLPIETVSGLQDATVELFVTGFSGGQPMVGGTNGFYQALFDVSNSFDSVVDQNNYVVVNANRDPANLSGCGLGMASRLFDEPEEIISSGSPLPTAGGLVTLSYQGFSKVGSIGIESVYLNGDLVARTSTIYSLAYIANAKEFVGASHVSIVGIGGGSPFRDATFNGVITEVRIWSGAMTPAQVHADFQAGPGTVPVVTPAP